MFKKNTYIKFSFPLQGKPFIEVNLNKNTNSDEVSGFFNKLLTREYLPYLLQSILDAGSNNLESQKIVSSIVELQRQLEIKSISSRSRNPLIKPSAVFTANTESE